MIVSGAEANQGLNEYQQRRLLVTCQYIDKLLLGVEEVLNASASNAAFPRYQLDISPDQRRTIEQYLARVRDQLRRALQCQEIPVSPPSIPASRSIRSALGFIDIALEELKPKYMRGYGPVPERAAAALNDIVSELRVLVGRLDRALTEERGEGSPASPAAYDRRDGMKTLGKENQPVD